MSKRRMPGLNTASVADISFTLLILFLVVTSIDSEKGLRRQLPPATPPEQNNVEQEVEPRNVMRIRILDDNTLTINDCQAEFGDIQNRVEQFVDNKNNLDTLPEKHPVDIPILGRCLITDKHVIQLSAERQACYQTWFTVQNEIIAAYSHLRDQLAQTRFSRSYSACNEEQREALRIFYPQRVAEEYIRQKGGDR